MINAWAKRSNPKQVLKWFARLQATGQQADVVTYSTVMHAHASVGDIESAERLLQDMRSHGIEPNTITFNAMLDACAKARDTRRAERMFTEMQQSGCELSPSSFNTMINAYAKSGDLVGAERCLRDMAKAGVEANARSFSPVIDACCKAPNQLHRAEELFKEMCAAGIAPTVVTYTSLARPCAQKGDWRRVEALRDQMEKQGVKSNAFFLCGLLTAYANASPKECDKAEREFKRAVRNGVKVDDYVITALERATGQNGVK